MICKGLDGIEIVHIDLSYNRISDTGVECLAECLKVSHLHLVVCLKLTFIVAL